MHELLLKLSDREMSGVLSDLSLRLSSQALKRSLCNESRTVRIPTRAVDRFCILGRSDCLRYHIEALFTVSLLGKCPHADPPFFRATFFADQPPSTRVCGQIRADKYRTVSRAFYGIYFSANRKECNPILLYHFIHCGFIPLSRYLYCSCAI
jgi:hypothetical protein